MHRENARRGASRYYSFSIEWRRRRAEGLKEARRICAQLGFPRVNRQQAARILEEHLGWPHDDYKPATLRLDNALEFIRKGGNT